MSETKVSTGRWAPWWVYVVVIVGANVAKQQLIGGRVSDVANVAITLAVAGVLVALITALYRRLQRSRA
jgi:hypothetical protein